ncbi:MAG: diphthine--ammonia ligase [Candidatus Omnitrophica bacterium]|nr:diphthine--ammonia ligase [Candidatus Omnitrophota bacterium]
MNKNIILSWSGGKDSAFCLYKISRDAIYKVRAILTTVSKDHERISMHGVRTELLRIQAERLDLPLEIVYIPKNSSQEEYEDAMERVLLRYKRDGIDDVAFGDIFLEDVRRNRTENLSKLDMNAIFPLWGCDTRDTAQELINAGFRSVITCVDLKVLNGSFSGRIYDEQFLKDLPAGVDPCGENGEFHSFVFDGPIFRRKIDFKKGRKFIRRKQFFYCDLLSAS